jgi:hypothetical protein
MTPHGPMKLLSAVTATGASDWIDARTMREKTLQVTGTFTGTVAFQGSNDGGTTAVSLGTDLTAAGKITNSEAWALVRANVTAFTAASGSITAVLFGIG